MIDKNSFYFVRRFLIFIFAVLASLNFTFGFKELICDSFNDEWGPINQTLFTCHVENQFINTDDISMASDLDNNITGIDFISNTQVQLIPADLSETFPSLVVVQFWTCSVKFIKESNFKGLTELLFINLGLNKIRHIEDGSFKDNTKLEYLWLGNNKLKYVSKNLFEPLYNLKELTLSDNGIRSIDALAFKSLINLENLELDRNEIKFFDLKSFEKLVNLKNISMSFNQLNAVDDDLLINNKKLEFVWLDFNEITYINYKIFDGMQNLKSVDLIGNDCVNEAFGASSIGEIQTHLKENCATLDQEAEEKRRSLEQKWTESCKLL